MRSRPSIPLLEPGGWLSVRNSGTTEANIVHARHRDGVDIVVAAIGDMVGGFGFLGVSRYTRVDHRTIPGHFFRLSRRSWRRLSTTYASGQPPFAFQQTVELMKLVVAGIRSREQGARAVFLSEIRP